MLLLGVCSQRRLFLPRFEELLKVSTQLRIWWQEWVCCEPRELVTAAHVAAVPTIYPWNVLVSFLAINARKKEGK